LSLIFGLIRKRQQLDGGLSLPGSQQDGVPGNHQDVDVVSMSNASFFQDDNPTLRSSFFDPPVEGYNPSLLLGGPGMLRIS
jgi:hypothetical protein